MVDFFVLFYFILVVTVLQLHCISSTRVALTKNTNALRANANPKSGDVITHAGPGRMAEHS